MKRFTSAVCLLVCLTSRASAAPSDAMEYGPALAATYDLGKGNVALRGVAVVLDAKDPKSPSKTAAAGAIFDTETLRYAGWWIGGFINYKGVTFSGSHGENPGPKGNVLVATKPGPGWAKDGKFTDPRPLPNGPLPRDHSRYQGRYLHGNDVVFAYTVGDTLILDKPGMVKQGDTQLFTRTLTLQPSTKEMSNVIAHLPGEKSIAPGTEPIASAVGERSISYNTKSSRILAQVAGGPKGTKLHIASDQLVLTIPASDKATTLLLHLWGGPINAKDAPDIKLANENAVPADLTPLTKGGPPRWTETVATKGTRGDDTKSAYTIDTLTPPFQNPYQSWLRFGGFDFFADGRAAVSTWSGDVWIVSGIDDKLQNLTWKRYATGLFQALGLKIVDDVVYVLGRDQITRLHDLNKDGEADYYECFNNDVMITPNFHEFIFDLQTDPAGNFYFVRGGPVRPGGSGWDKLVPHHGCLFKVSKDGSKLDVVARGFRAPNGMGIGPKGQITTGDNEGTWTPTCPINWIEPGHFYGVPEFAGKDPKKAVRDNPLCWLPRDVDNSNGGQVWIDGDQFGPLSGKLLHTSYGTSTLYEVLPELVGGQHQGGVVPLLKFDSGVCRARFDPKQNALYLAGLRGWQTNASKDAGLYRVRYTGKPANLPVDLKVRPGTIALTFSDPLDKSLAEDADNYTLEQWNYRWTSGYGSPQFKVSDPKKQGHDEVEVESAKLSSDGKTVTLSVKELRPVMQMKIACKLKAADGTPIQRIIHNTINVVGDQRGEVHPGEYKIVRSQEAKE